MDFFDIGPGELVLILIVALIVMGPGKIVHISRELGKIMHSLRRTTSDLTAQITRELDVEEKAPKHLPPVKDPIPELQETKGPPPAAGVSVT